MTLTRSTITKILLAVSLAAMAAAPAFAAGVSGAIFTTNANGTLVNGNHYDSKCAVYLSGGPGPHAPAHAAALPDGDYYFQVTDPSGAQLLSTDPVSNRRFRVSGGVITAYTGTGGPAHPTGIDQDEAALGGVTIGLANVNCPSDFLNSPNPGGVYKAWATPVGSFVGNPASVDYACSGGCAHGFLSSQSKTDNFHAQASTAVTFSLTIQKQFFDGTTFADTLGWGMSVTDPLNVTNHVTTDVTGQITLNQLVAGTYTVTEDSSGPTPTPPPGCTFNVKLQQVTVTGAAFTQVGNSVTFTNNSSAPVTIVFVNSLLCPG